MRYTVVAIAASTLALVASASPSYRAPLYTPPAPESEFGVQSETSHIIPDSYIVVLQHGTDKHKHKNHVNWIQSTHLNDFSASSFTGLRHEYNIGGMAGYSGHFSDNMLEQIRQHPDVRYVERDSVVWASDIERGAPWGLARLSHRKELRFGTFDKYEYDEHSGAGVTAYVIDTGVNIKHVEFEGRAEWGKTIPLNDQDIDANGHGSHVAGTIGSRKYGVAKNATIVAVKVLGSNGSGSMSDVVGGVDWAAKHAKAKAEEARATNNKSHKGSVANMSLGGGKSIALDEAVNNAVDTGLHFAVAAGNDNRDACTFSPAAASNPVTVGASAINDARAYFSNHGKCVDVFAPGLNILSTWNGGNNTINKISGTSMASPHVCGLMAYFLSLYPVTFSPTAEDYMLAGVESPFEVQSSGFFAQTKQTILGTLGQWIGYQPMTMQKSHSSKPKHPDVISPKVLKQALIRIATPGVLTDLPEHTVNKLIFNNFTRNV